MTLYIFVYLWTIVGILFAEKSLKQKKFSAFFYLSIISLSAPILLATFRDIGVGTDTETYVSFIWSRVLSQKDFVSLLNAYINGEFNDIEPVYLFVNWVASWFGNDIHWLFFFSISLTIIPIFWVACLEKDKMSLTIFVTLFLLLYYTTALNLVRQTLALSFSNCALYCFRKSKWGLTILWTTLVMLSHNTGIFFLLFFVMFRFSKIKGKKVFIMKILFVLIIVAGYFYGIKIALLIISSGFFPEKYLAYVENIDDTGLSRSSLLTHLIILLSFFIVYKTSKIKGNSKKMCLAMIKMKSFGTLLFMSSLISMWTFRLSYYFNFCVDLVFLPESLQLLKEKNRGLYNVTTIGLFLGLTISFLWLSVVVGWNGIYPYRSSILGF